MEKFKLAQISNMKPAHVLKLLKPFIGKNWKIENFKLAKIYIFEYEICRSLKTRKGLYWLKLKI